VSRAGSFVRPPALRPADTVAVVAPAGPFDRSSFEAGLAILAARYRVRVGEGIFARARYLAGDDGRRLDELAAALADDDVRAVIAARGGYGAMRLLARLAPKLAGLRPRAVVGFSDITALHGALQAAGWVSIHGPVVTQLGGQPPEVVERLFRLLESPAEPAPALSGVPLVGGVAEGPLVGGNLSVLTRLLGTPHLPPLDGAVLLLEDIGERPYRLDRMWTHLALAGVFGRVRGLALGEFTDCEDPAGEHGSAEVLAELAAETGLPCVGELAIGHGAVNEPVPLGARVRLDAAAGRLEFLEPAVSP
jgi:muramoyltetrapeptide carboxypeptidase